MVKGPLTNEERLIQDEELEETLEGMERAYNSMLEEWEDDEEPVRVRRARRPAKKREPKPAKVCDDCKNVKQFSFEGCMTTCKKFMGHLGKVADGKGSPCRDFRCQVPGVSIRNRSRCERCPILDAYNRSLGKPGSSKDMKCKLGGSHTPYMPASAYKYDPNVKH